MFIKLKKLIRIALGKDIYIATQVKGKTTYVGNTYGGFDIADNYLNIKTNIVYSFGIGEDLSFSEELIKKYDVNIFAFDPTPKSIKYVNKHSLKNNPRFHFYPFGLSDKDEMETFYLPQNPDHVSASVVSHNGVNTNNAIEVQMKCLKSIMSDLNHDHIDILKIDIEGSEFKVIPHILIEGLYFSQLCVEIHHKFFNNKQKKRDDLIRLLNKYNYYIIKVSNDTLTFVKK